MSNICETYQWLAIKTFDIIVIPIVNHYDVNCQESKRKNAITGIGKLQGFEHNASQVKYIRSISCHIRSISCHIRSMSRHIRYHYHQHWQDHRNRRYHNYQWNHLTFMKSLSDQSVRIFATNVRLCCYFRNTSTHGLWFSEKGMLSTGGKLLHNGWKICELPSNYFSLTCQQNSFTEF